MHIIKSTTSPNKSKQEKQTKQDHKGGGRGGVELRELVIGFVGHETSIVGFSWFIIQLWKYGFLYIALFQPTRTTQQLENHT